MQDHEHQEESQPQTEAYTEHTPSTLSREELEAALEEANRERNQFRSLAQRVQADFVNYKRRMEEERGSLQKEASSQLILRLLPVLDDLERVVRVAREQQDYPAWLEGVDLLYRKFHETLEAEGVTALRPQGEPFDPWQHEAVFYEASDQYPDGYITHVVRTGYLLHSRVLRPAQVVVAKGGSQEDRPADPAQETGS